MTLIILLIKMEKQNDKNKNSNVLSTKNKLNKLNTGKNIYGLLSPKKKVENEISLMTKENRDEFRDALNKYNFDSEVFIPKTLSINKNEYKNKNYLINNLVHYEMKSIERRNIVEPLKKETSRFTKQYQLIKEENEEHQKDYLKSLENFYSNIGYNQKSLDKMNENIFMPSTVLDHDFGISLGDDAFKYNADINLRNVFNSDHELIQQWQKSIQEAKENKSRIRRFREENEIDIMEVQEKKEKEKETEMKSSLFHKELEKIKNNLMEENRIRNMSRREYYYYNRKIKKDILTTKKLLKAFDEDKNQSYLNPIKLTLNNNIDDNKIIKSYKIIHPSQPKNYKEKIVFASLDLNNKNKEQKIKKVKNKLVKNYLTPKFTIKERIRNKSPKSITENNIFISIDKDKSNNDKIDLPKLPSILDTEQDYNKPTKKRKTNNENKDKEKDKDKIKSEAMSKKIKQEKDLDKLYHLVNSNKNILEKYPSKSVEVYFRKYTKKKLPILNYKKGSDIHGLLDDFQQIIKKKDFYKFAETTNEVKDQLIYKKGLSDSNIIEDKNMSLDVEKLQELDNKIPELHYIFAENLLTNKEKKENKRDKF